MAPSVVQGGLKRLASVGAWRAPVLGGSDWLGRFSFVFGWLGFMLEFHFPDVAAEENFDRCREWHGEQRAEEAADEKAPEEDGEDHCQRMEADGLADNLGCRHEAVHLLGDGEDANDNERVDPDLADAEELVVWGAEVPE